MRTFATGLLALLAAAGAAQAEFIDSYDAFAGVQSLSVNLDHPTGAAVLEIGSFTGADVSQVSVMTDDFADTMLVYEGLACAGGAEVLSVGWQVDATSYSPNVLLDLRIAVMNSLGEGIVITPFEGVPFPGTLSAASADLGGAGSLGMIALNTPELGFSLADNGVIEIAFFTAFDSNPGVDFEIPQGFVAVQTAAVPAPGVLALAGAIPPSRCSKSAWHCWKTRLCALPRPPAWRPFMPRWSVSLKPETASSAPMHCLAVACGY